MAESTRSFWKGSLRLSLVIIPVRLVSATRTDAKVSFHQVDRKTKQRIRYQKVVPGGRVVDKSDIVSGYEVEDGSYVLLDADELDAIKLKTRHTIELTQFVDACEVDPLYFDQPYYILPDGDVAEEGYRVIRDALREARKVGIGQLTLRGREHLVALEAAGRGLVLQTLRYEDEIKDSDKVFSDIPESKLRKDLVDMAKDLIQSKSQPFDAGHYKNHYAEALRDLVKEKLENHGAVDVGEDEAKPKSNVLDFMEALKRSVAGGGRESGDAEAPAPARKSPPAKAAAKPAAKSKPARTSGKTSAKAAPRGNARPAKKPAPRRRATG